VPDECPAGTEGCRCYGNRTCDPLDGVPMTCDGNVCARTDTPEEGELNGACGEDGSCGGEGDEALVCVNGACELQACPSGTAGCPCEIYGRCESTDAEPLLCSDGLCLPPDCSGGQVGCPCDDERPCQEGAECVLGFCRRKGTASIEVAGAGVRACDVVVALPELAGAEAEFAAAYLGETYQRGQRFALSFMAKEDEDIVGEVAVVRRVPIWFGDPATGWRAPVTVESQACYDRAGVVVADGHVAVR